MWDFTPIITLCIVPLHLPHHNFCLQRSEEAASMCCLVFVCFFFLKFSSSFTADISCILLVLQTFNASFKFALAPRAILI